MGEFEIKQRGRGEGCEWVIVTCSQHMDWMSVRDYVRTYYGEQGWQLPSWWENTIDGGKSWTANPTQHNGIYTWRLKKEVKDG